MGDSEIDQIFKIFKVLGTPHENNWPDALKLKDFKPSFPKFRGMPMQEHTPSLDELEVDLLAGMCALDPNKRISALQALHHPYFDSMDKGKINVRSNFYQWEGRSLRLSAQDSPCLHNLINLRISNLYSIQIHYWGKKSDTQQFYYD